MVWLDVEACKDYLQRRQSGVINNDLRRESSQRRFWRPLRLAKRREEDGVISLPALPSLVTTPVFLIALTLPVLLLMLAIIVSADRLADVAIALSVLTAIAGFLFNSAIKLHADIRDRTFDFLLSSQSDKDLRSALENLGFFFRDHGVVSIDEAIKIVSNKGHDGHQKICNDISYVGNFFEKLHIAAKYGEIHHRILRDYYRGMLSRYVEGADPFIQVMRNSPPIANSPFKSLERPKILSGVYALHNAWQK